MYKRQLQYSFRNILHFRVVVSNIVHKCCNPPGHACKPDELIYKVYCVVKGTAAPFCFPSSPPVKIIKMCIRDRLYTAACIIQLKFASPAPKNT